MFNILIKIKNKLIPLDGLLDNIKEIIDADTSQQTEPEVKRTIKLSYTDARKVKAGKRELYDNEIDPRTGKDHVMTIASDEK